jgi:4-carboxymuconolactone decarboxylase
MARLPELTSREGLPADALPAFDAITASRGRVGGLFAVLMHSPEVAARTAHFGTYIRFEKSLAQPVHELAMIVGAHECGGELEWRGHSRAAREAGVAEATIEAVEHDRDLSALPAGDALVVRLGRSLLRDHHVDDATFEAARAAFGERGVVDLVATLGYQALLGCVLNGLEIKPA